MEEKVERLDYELTKDKFGEWAPKFKPFIESEAMWKIITKLREDKQRETIVPDSKNTFRAFSTTSPNDLKVIFYLMDPYPRRYSSGDRELQATGIALDCSNTPNGKLQPSLDIWYDAIEKDLGKKVRRSPDLTYLHEQGVMLLN